MKRLAILAAVLTLVAQTHRAMAQTSEPGPGAGGSVLKDPFAPAAPVKPPPSWR